MKKINLKLSFYLILLVTGLFLVTISITSVAQNEQEQIKMMQDMAPYQGYIQAHGDIDIEQVKLLGGPVSVEISQDGGSVYAIMPSNRKLDPTVFGNPEFPRAFAGTPGFNGVPLMARGIEDGEYTIFKEKSPFGNEYMVFENAKLEINATDITATDATQTEDQLSCEASWTDNEGNTYGVKVNQLVPRGLEFPTFGGVVTNHILHGSSRVGTALMPTEFAYFAFWGLGEISKNGEVVDKPKVIHGMLTEYVRKEGYELAMDHEVNPEGKHFHLLVAPFMPDMENGIFKHLPAKTGFMLPNGMELPFWHVMFESIQINSQ